MNLRRPLWAASLILLMTLTLTACDILDDASAGFDSGQIVDAQARCTEAHPHPIGESIADQFDVDYDQVMVWFCNGEGFDDILLALQTAELSSRDPEELLDDSDAADSSAGTTTPAGGTTASRQDSSAGTTTPAGGTMIDHKALETYQRTEV